MPLPPSLSLSLSLSLTHTHTHIEWNLHDSGAAPSIALAPCCLCCAAPSIALAPPSPVWCGRLQSPRRLLHSRTVYCTLAPPSIALSRRRQSHSRRRQRRLRHTYFLVSVRCFCEEKVWSAVLVGKSAILVIALALLSIALTLPLIALMPSIASAPPSIALRKRKKNA